MDIKEHFGTEVTRSKQRAFSVCMRDVVTRGKLSEREIEAFVTTAMDYMMSYAADAYDRGLQTGMEVGYAHGLKEAKEAIEKEPWEKGARILH